MRAEGRRTAEERQGGEGESRNEGGEGRADVREERNGELE